MKTLVVLLLSIQVPAAPHKPPAINLAEGIQSDLRAAKRAAASTPAMMKLIEQGLTATEEALTHEPDSLRARLYRVAFLRQKAPLLGDANERALVLTEADRLYAHVLQARLAPATPAPANSPSLSAAVFGEEFADTSKRLHPITNTLEFYPRPVMRFYIDPVYARGERAPTAPAVIVSLLINQAGDVVNARIVRSVQRLDRAVMEAVSVRTFTPPQFKGRPVACIMTVAVPTVQ